MAARKPLGRLRLMEEIWLVVRTKRLCAAKFDDLFHRIDSVGTPVREADDLGTR